jgi:hypothetical protein
MHSPWPLKVFEQNMLTVDVCRGEHNCRDSVLRTRRMSCHSLTWGSFCEEQEKHKEELSSKPCPVPIEFVL